MIFRSFYKALFLVAFIVFLAACNVTKTENHTTKMPTDSTSTPVNTATPTPWPIVGREYRIAYTYHVWNSMAGHPDFYLVFVNADGSDRIELSSLSDNLSFKGVSWSPNHELLMVLRSPSDYTGSKTEIDFYDQKGNLKQKFIPDEYASTVWQAIWLNDSKIAFLSPGRYSSDDIWTYDLVSGEQSISIMGTVQDTINTRMSISPDGKKLAFEHNEFSSKSYLFMVDFDASTFPISGPDVYNKLVSPVFSVYKGLGSVNSIQWTADSKNIVYRDSYSGILRMDLSTFTPSMELKCGSGLYGWERGFEMAHTTNYMVCTDMKSVYLVDANGHEAPIYMAADHNPPQMLYHVAWSDDDKYILFSENGVKGEGATKIRVITAQGDEVSEFDATTDHIYLEIGSLDLVW